LIQGAKHFGSKRDEIKGRINGCRFGGGAQRGFRDIELSLVHHHILAAEHRNWSARGGAGLGHEDLWRRVFQKLTGHTAINKLLSV